MKEYMTETQRVFMALLKAGLWGGKPEADDFRLKEGQWKQIYLLARKQTVQAVLLDGVSQLPVSCLPPQGLLMAWIAEVDSVERMNRRMNRVVCELSAFFAGNGIRAVLLKGQGIAACYGNRLHRVCGDADWCFPVGQDWERANRLMEDKRMAVYRQAGFSTVYQWDGCVIEHHKRMLDVHNPFAASYVQNLVNDESSDSRTLGMEEGEVTILSPVLMHLSVTIHILKHMLAFGIGMRQLCDVACIYRHYYKEVDGGKLEQVYRRIGMFRWVQELDALLVKHLGLPEIYLPFPLSGKEKVEWMMKDVLQSGNFGFYNDGHGGHANAGGRRKNVAWQLLRRFRMNICYAPAETCWFPLVQAYSHINFKRK